MDKNELFRELSRKISTGEVTPEEVGMLLRGPSPEVRSIKTPAKHSHFSVTKMLYALGAAIVVIGIVILIGQIWDEIGPFGRISVTLGLGVVFTAIGSILLKQKPQDHIGPIFHFIGGLLIPGGAIVTLLEFEVVGDWTVAITYAVLALFYLLLALFHKHAVLTFFAIANATVAMYLFLGAIVGGPFRGWFGIVDIYQYMTMAISICYLLLGYGFRGGWNKRLVRVMYILGIIGFLGAAYSQVFNSPIWQLLYFLIVIGALFLSVYFRSRGILTITTLFLIAYVSYITGQYFADSIGWPVSLVILGFVFIALGYASITINNKYIKGVSH